MGIKNKESEVKYPKGEDVCATYYSADHDPLFLLTLKPQTGVYFLYEFTTDGLIKLGKAQSPIELEDKYEVKKAMGC